MVLLFAIRTLNESNISLSDFIKQFKFLITQTRIPSNKPVSVRAFILSKFLQYDDFVQISHPVFLIMFFQTLYKTNRTANKRVKTAFKTKKDTIPLRFSRLADRTGLEPATSCVTGRCSNQLNYRSAKEENIDTVSFSVLKSSRHSSALIDWTLCNFAEKDGTTHLSAR